MTEQEFAEKAVKLRPAMETLWNTLRFGTGPGEVNLLMLEIEMPDKTKRQCTPEEFLGALRKSADLIEKKTPWLGTPPEDKPAELFKFYCGVLAAQKPFWQN